MRGLGLLIFALCVIATSSATAGAWPREKATSFVALSFSVDKQNTSEVNSFLEFGVRDDLTVGANMTVARTAQDSERGYATIFLRRPLRFSTDTHMLSYEVGLGGRWTDTLFVPHLKTGLSWGTGITLRERHGWVNIDTSVAWSLSSDAHLAKIETTFGLNVTDMTTTIIQLNVEHRAGHTKGYLEPSVIIKPKGRALNFKFGMRSDIQDFRDTAINLGIWRQF